MEIGIGMEKAPSTRAMAIFGGAAASDDRDTRAAYLDRACEGDSALRAEVESLLSTLGRIGGFLDGPDMQGTSALEPEGARPAPVFADFLGSLAAVLEDQGCRDEAESRRKRASDIRSAHQKATQGTARPPPAPVVDGSG